MSETTVGCAKCGATNIPTIGHEPCPGGSALMPAWDALQALETISSGWNADLKIDTGDARLWCARTGLEDGEPYEHTVYAELCDDGKWLDLGHYDGDDPPRGLPGLTPHAFRGET